MKKPRENSFIYKYFKGLKDNEFVRNVAKLSIAEIVYYSIALVSLPVITRFYFPKDFGQLAIFVSFVTIISSFASLSYDKAIIVAKEDEDSRSLFILSLIVCAITTAVVIILSFVLLPLFAEKGWLWINWLSFGVFVTGIYPPLNYWLTRKKRFRVIASSRIIQSLLVVSLQLIGGIAFLGGWLWLILGQVLGQLYIALRFLFNIKDRDGSMLRKENLLNQIAAVVKKYKEFPKYLNVSYLFSAASLYAPPIILAFFFDLKTVGLFALGNRFCQIAVAILGKSVYMVFSQKAAYEYNTFGSTLRILKKITAVLFCIFFLPSLLIMFFGKKIFGVVFGSEWVQAGLFVQVLMPLLLTRLVVSPVSSIILISGDQKYFMFWQSIYFISMLVALFIGGIKKNIILSLALYAVCGTFMYIVLLRRCFALAKKR